MGRCPGLARGQHGRWRGSADGAGWIGFGNGLTKLPTVGFIHFFYGLKKQFLGWYKLHNMIPSSIFDFGAILWILRSGFWLWETAPAVAGAELFWHRTRWFQGQSRSAISCSGSVIILNPPVSIHIQYMYIYIHVHIHICIYIYSTLWLFNIAMEAMAHRNRWFSQRHQPPFIWGIFHGYVK